jgi:hypothetical protein
VSAVSPKAKKRSWSAVARPRSGSVARRREQPGLFPGTLKTSLFALRLFQTAEGLETGKVTPTSRTALQRPDQRPQIRLGAGIPMFRTIGCQEQPLSDHGWLERVLNMGIPAPNRIRSSIADESAPTGSCPSTMHRSQLSVILAPIRCHSWMTLSSAVSWGNASQISEMVVLVTGCCRSGARSASGFSTWAADRISSRGSCKVGPCRYRSS